MRGFIRAACIVLSVAMPAMPQGILVPSGSTLLSGPITIRTPRGAVDGSVIPIEPSRNVTAVLLLETLSGADADTIRSGLQTIFTAIPDLRIEKVSASNIQTAGPFPPAA